MGEATQKNGANNGRFRWKFCLCFLVLAIFGYFLVAKPGLTFYVTPGKVSIFRTGVFDKWPYYDRSDGGQTLVPSTAERSTHRTLSPPTVANLVEPACKFPHLLVDDPSLSEHMKHYEPLKCAKQENWVFTENGTFRISPHAQEKHGKIACDYFHIYRKDDDHWDETRFAVKDGDPLRGDIFRVECNGTRGGRKKYRNLHAAVQRNPRLLARKPSAEYAKQMEAGPRLNVLVYLMDSLSRINFIRKLPKLYGLLTNEMGAVVMEGFNIVGDGTPWTLIPIVTGHFQTELYEGRKRFKNSSTLDKWPLIFKNFTRAGYVTSFAEEQPAFSFFSYKLRGFKDPPVDHYLRPYEQAVSWVSSKHKDYCLGDTPRSVALNHWWAEQQAMYRPAGVPTFSILFSSETSHDDYNLVQVLDVHWERVFRDQHQKGLFNDTLLVVMGDHGRRFGPVRQTQSGKMEEKLPFLAVVVPSRFQAQWPRAFANLQANAHRLVNPFDIHETLMSVINWPSVDLATVGDLQHRGIPLFREIPPERTCRHAAIKPHFCSCLDWENVDANSSEVTEALAFVLGEFNGMLKDGEGKCAKLSLESIISAAKLKPNHDLMAFKESRDYDNIFPDLTADDHITSVLYQIRFRTHPNLADYEVSLTRFLELKGSRKAQWSLDMSDVSRLNMYGEQPRCIMDTHQHLRAYCYCL